MALHIPTNRERRALGAAFGLCALASVTLLANHPSGGNTGLAAVINDEANHQLIDGIVHGGFIGTLAVLMTCWVFLFRWLGSMRAPVVIGLVAFCIGSGILIATMALDGFVTPAIAVRFAGSGDLQSAKTLLILLGAFISVLMPMGILFQSVAMFSWSSVIVRGSGLRRAAGAFGLVAAVALMAAIIAVPAAKAAHVMMGAIVLQSIWYLMIAVLLFYRGSWSAA